MTNTKDIKVLDHFAAKRVEEVEMIFSVLKDLYPKLKIDISYDYSKKYYDIKLLNVEEIQESLDIPLDLDVQVVYGDTDSIMCKYSYNRDDKKANRLDTFRLGELCGEKLTQEIFNRHPIEMEFENVKNPFILLAKKHYIGKKFEDKKDPLKMKGYDIKGVALTKRNYCNLLKKCYKQVIDYIMENEEKSIDGIKDIVQKYLDDIRLYKVDIEDLVITASLAKTYKNENLPHVCLANKLRARKEEVQVGDRIPFIFIEDKEGMTTKKFERAEDPKYAKEHNLKIDRLSYLDQVTKPILGLLKIVLKRHPKEFNLILSRINETIVECNGKPLKEKDLVEIDENVLE